VLGACGASANSAALANDAGDDAGAILGDDAAGDDGGFALDAQDDASSDGANDGALPYAPGERCEYAFFKKYFDRDNGPSYAALRDQTFAYIDQQVKTLNACGGGVTLGGMLSLMIYEGGGAKVAFFNDLCSENSYDASATCWTDPKARYSYQYGLAPVHTSNFHPCADVAYTSKMRARLAKAIADAGFAPSAAAIAGVASDLHTFCPSSTPTVVDYYILTTHSAFGVPKDSTGNDLANAGKYPFFTPRVVIDLFFAEISGSCSSLTSDAAAIAVYGGSDASYRTTAKQQQILALYSDFASQNPGVCPLAGP
jgi:hypothetical protein